jgi:predicted transcriptional regulator
MTNRNRGRNRLEIICQILEVANGGVTKKIKMMYGANLCSAQLKEYLMVLNETDLVRYDIGTQTFKTTEKGVRFLHTYNQMIAVMHVKK